MGKNKRKDGVVHWDRSPQVLDNVSDSLSSLPAIQGTADVTAVLCHVIDENCKVFYRLGYEHGKASALAAEVAAISETSGAET